MTDPNRQKIREGNSWRAQVYRHKDAVLTFPTELLSQFLQSKKETQAAKDVLTRLDGVNKCLKTLDQSPDDEKAGKDGVASIDALLDTLKQNGFDPSATPAAATPEEKPDDEQTEEASG